MSDRSKNSKEVLTPDFFQNQLKEWYRLYHRALPWRRTKSPYHIWVSEIILQQTRIVQGQGYYERIIAKFPALHHLASAQEDEVLRLWQGLGYYTRARNLHACAKKIVKEHNGIFPKSYKELIKLPGVGPYTAAAIASIAFEERVAVVDGNVYRVLARLFAIEKDIALPSSQKEFKNLATLLLPEKNIGMHNQAIMELGALVCTPKSPSCGICIFREVCLAYRDQKQSKLPIKGNRIEIKKRYFHYFVIGLPGKVYLKKRVQKDIWQGLYDFYLVEAKKLEKVENLEDDLIKKMINFGLSFEEEKVIYEHRLTHQKLYLVFFYVRASAEMVSYLERTQKEHKLNPISYGELKKVPFPAVLNNFISCFLSKI